LNRIYFNQDNPLKKRNWSYFQGTKSSVFQPEDYLSCFVFGTAHAFNAGSPTRSPSRFLAHLQAAAAVFLSILREPSFALFVSLSNFEFGPGADLYLWDSVVCIQIYTSLRRFVDLCVCVFSDLFCNYPIWQWSQVGKTQRSRAVDFSKRFKSESSSFSFALKCK